MTGVDPTPVTSDSAGRQLRSATGYGRIPLQHAGGTYIGQDAVHGVWVGTDGGYAPQERVVVVGPCGENADRPPS